MGHKQSSISNSKASSPPLVTSSVVSGPMPPLAHACVLQGLSGSGRSSVQKQLGLSEGKKLEVDVRFLTTPEIFSTSWGGNNFPGYDRRSMDKSIWSYGGRGSIRARWATAAFQTKAIIFCVDSTDPARLVPAPGFQPLPNEFVAAFTHRSAQEQREIQATLEKTMDAKTTLHKLLGHFELRRKPLLVLATKQDQPGALSVEEICRLLDLPSLQQRDWRIAGCDAVRGEGLRDSVDWLHYIVAHPTDWSAAEKAKPRLSQQEQEAAWAAEEAVRKAQQEARERRDQRLEKGYVLQAPPVFHTDGTRWQASEEQRQVFVVAPLTPDEPAPAQEPEAQAAVVEAAKPDEQPAAPATPTEPAETSNEPLETSDPPLETSAGEPAQVEGVAAAPPAKEAAAQAEARKLLAEVAQALEQTLEGAGEGQPAEGDAAVKKQPAGVTKQLSKFAALGSTHVVLPAEVPAPPVPMKKFKKHWYSRTKMVPVAVDIHGMSSGGDFWFD